MIMFEISFPGTAKLEFEKGGLIVKEWLTVEEGILSWGKITADGGTTPTKCIDNPSATYEIYITGRGDQPESLRFVLVGTDNCADRQEFLDGKTMRWVPPEG